MELTWTISRCEAVPEEKFGKIVLVAANPHKVRKSHPFGERSPPKLAVSAVVGFIKGKSAIHVARHFLKRERNYAGQPLWARGFFVDTVGRDTETIRRYIQEQEATDRRLDQLELPINDQNQ